MTEENSISLSQKEEMVIPSPEVKPSLQVRRKRDIFRFAGEKDMAINLEHITSMYVEGKRITFQFYSTATYIELQDDTSAKKVFEQIIVAWASDVIQ